ncbi:MAG: hypothetical protein RL254_1226 [Planctomycetota bacterium]|jgi:hypothetical protein
MTDKKRGPGQPQKPDAEKRVMASFRLAQDVIAILKEQPNASRFVDDAVREKHKTGEKKMTERYWNVGEEFLDSLADKISEECRESARQAVIESWEDEENMLAVGEEGDFNSLFFLSPLPDTDLFPEVGGLKSKKFSLLDSIEWRVMAPFDDLDHLPEKKAHPGDIEDSLLDIGNVRRLAAAILGLADDLEKRIAELPARDN